MKCPHCGHPDRLHTSPTSRYVTPGTCQCGPPDTPCRCPGWRYWLQGDEWQQEMQFEQDRVEKHFGPDLGSTYEGDEW